MLRRLLNLFRSPPLKVVRYVPSALELPAIWADAGDNRRVPKLALLESASSAALLRLCDDFWDSYADDDDFEQPMIRDACVYRHALDILATRGRDGLAWAHAHLRHPEYYARQDAASLIWQLAQSGQLGQDAEVIGDELVHLALRPPVEDTKEAQAASAALTALSAIGGSACMKAVRGVLTSPDWDQDDNQWQAAEILAGITTEAFMEANDPVAAAKTWLKANPE